MKNLLSIKGLKMSDVDQIFDIADNIAKYKDVLSSKNIVVFFPDTSVRTFISFETAITGLGGKVIRFPATALDRGEEIRDIAGYMNNWVDGVVVRHSSDEYMKEMADNFSSFVINAMSKNAHPCEILSDLYAFKKCGINIKEDSFIFVGPKGNIGNSYFEASKILGFRFIQVCLKGDEIDGADVSYELYDVIQEADVILTDSLDEAKRKEYKKFIIDDEVIKKAKDTVLVNPCPPLHRGFEVAESVVNSKGFVGYKFKAYLEVVQAAIIVFLENNRAEREN